MKLTREAITKIWGVEGIVLTDDYWKFLDSIKDLPRSQQIIKIMERAKVS